MSLRGFLHAFLTAAAGTLLLWLNVTFASLWVTIFSALLVLFLIMAVLLDPERIWRRIGSTLITAAVVPSGITAALTADSTITGIAKFVGSVQVISAPEWLLLLFGSAFLFLDGVWIRVGAMWGKGFWPTALQQELHYRAAVADDCVATGALYLKSHKAREFTLYGASISDFWWMRMFRSVNIDEHGFVVRKDGVWQEPSNERPVELGRRKSIVCQVRLKFREGRLIKFARNNLKRLPGQFGQSATTVIRVRFVGSDLNVTVSAAQAV